MKNFIQANTEFMNWSIKKDTNPMLIYCNVANKYFVTIWKLDEKTIIKYNFNVIRN
jgi:hypothetical protein